METRLPEDLGFACKELDSGGSAVVKSLEQWFSRSK